MNTKKLLLIIIALSSIFFFTGCKKEEQTNKITIITTNFPCYDFVRSIIKSNDNIELKMLLKPGTETHSFEPTPQNIKDIKNSSLFVYVGGESDSWIDDILNDIDTNKTKIVKLMDLVDVVEEEIIEGIEEEHDREEVEYDEHVWTNPINAIKIIEQLKQEIINIDNSSKELYETNASQYINEIKNIDSQIRNTIETAKRKEIIFGDRFPLRYFTDEYGLTYYAAFPGCAEQTEASAKTISFLINKIKEDNIPVIFHIELSSSNIANTISQETGAKILEFNSAHNISQTDFNSGVTYVDIMNKNIEALKIALN